MSNIKHLFSRDQLNQKSFCLVKIAPKDYPKDLLNGMPASQNSLDSWVSNLSTQKRYVNRYLTFGFGKI